MLIVGKGHCFTCHKETQPNEHHWKICLSLGSNQTECTPEMCGEWYYKRKELENNQE